MAESAINTSPVWISLPGFDFPLQLRPIVPADLHRACEFFAAIPEPERNYYRFDVTDRREIEQRLQVIARWHEVKRLIALAGETIVATGALELHAPGWKRHVAELRVSVHPDHRRRGLAKMMINELYKLAAKEKIEELVVQLMLPQEAAHGIVKRLGFREVVVIPRYVRDQHGELQDLRIMRCDLKTLWQEMEHFAESFDVRTHR